MCVRVCVCICLFVCVYALTCMWGGGMQSHPITNNDTANPRLAPYNFDLESIDVVLCPCHLFFIFSLHAGNAISELYSAAISYGVIIPAVEDVFITGVLAEIAHIPRIHHPGFNYWYFDNKDACKHKFMSGHGVSAQDTLWLWKNQVKENKGSQKLKKERILVK